MDADQLTDAQLFAAGRQGDRAAMACLIDRHKDRLVNYLTRMCGCRDRAEDLAQETFLRLFQRSHRYREQGKLLPYVYQIATNLVRSSERRERRWRFLGPLYRYQSSNGHHGEPAQQARVLRHELARRLVEALSELPFHYRAPLVLRDVEEWSYREIASSLGCREGTVKSRIHRGRELLRKELAPYWTGGTS